MILAPLLKPGTHWPCARLVRAGLYCCNDELGSYEQNDRSAQDSGVCICCHLTQKSCIEIKILVVAIMLWSHFRFASENATASADGSSSVSAR